MLDLLRTLLEEFQEKMLRFDGGIKREICFPDIKNKIMVAIGMRRVGKTYLMLQTIKELLNSIPITRILYINFEDDRLMPMEQNNLAELMDGFYSLYPENHDQECYIFLDEIQNVKNWHEVIRRYFDTKNVKIYLTGSSSKLLSKEIGTSLRGRSVAIEVWPLSFKEKYGEIKSVLGQPSLDKFKQTLNQYLDEGGFPEVIDLRPEERSKILREYVSVVIFRDIVERYHVTNISLVRYLIKTLLRNVGGSLSTNKLFNDLKSQGFNIGKMTVYDYLDYISDAYLAFQVPLYSESLRKTESNLKKIYAVDTGLVKAYSMTLLENKGHYFENLFFLDLKRKGHEVYYYLTQSRKEIDFLSRDLLGKWHMHQVCLDLS
ncbi:MAG: ATP-binding protein, partial [Alphaproteobacteria bacterium]|nr:ATP-binding protein [Alphaproteobacteria bacterium]